MEFQVINRNRNAVIPEGMFKLCGMEDAKLMFRLFYSRRKSLYPV